MACYEDVNNIKLLQQLLQPTNELSDSDAEDEHLPATGVHKFGPGDIGASAKNPGPAERPSEPGSATSTYKDVYAKNINPQANSIEEWQERQEREDTDALDSRKQLNYRISYKQSVTTEDVFLQMGNKTGATASCDQMIVTIEMPEEVVPIDRMNLAVNATEIDLQSPVYRLRLPLPQRIDPDAGCALYDADLKRMILRLKMVREFDYINF